MRVYACGLFLLICLAGNCKAQKTGYQITPLPVWARPTETLIDLDSLARTVDKDTRILRPSSPSKKAFQRETLSFPHGRDLTQTVYNIRDAGDIFREYCDSHGEGGSFQLHELYLYRGGQVINSLTGLQSSHESESRFKDQDPLKSTICWRMPTMQPGDLVVISHSHALDPVPGNDPWSFGLFDLGGDFQQHRVDLLVDHKYPLHYIPFHFPAQPIQERRGLHNQFSVTNPVKEGNTQDNPPIWYPDRPGYVIATQSLWSEIVDQQILTLKLEQEVSDTLAQLAKSLTKDATSTQAVIDRLIHFIDAGILALPIPEKKPKAPLLTLNQKAGGSYSRAWLLVGLLRAIGLDAFLMLTSQRGYPPNLENYPTDFFLNHPLVAIEDAQEIAIIDLESTYPHLQVQHPDFRQGLLLKPGMDSLTDIPTSIPTQIEIHDHFPKTYHDFRTQLVRTISFSGYELEQNQTLFQVRGSKGLQRRHENLFILYRSLFGGELNKDWYHWNTISPELMQVTYSPENCFWDLSNSKKGYGACLGLEYTNENPVEGDYILPDPFERGYIELDGLPDFDKIFTLQFPFQLLHVTHIPHARLQEPTRDTLTLGTHAFQYQQWTVVEEDTLQIYYQLTTFQDHLFEESKLVLEEVVQTIRENHLKVPIVFEKDMRWYPWYAFLWQLPLEGWEVFIFFLLLGIGWIIRRIVKQRKRKLTQPGSGLLVFLIALFMGAESPAQQPIWSTVIDSVSLFSSPQASDLNGDGVLDIVLGGGAEGVPLRAGITALDGATGSILWQRPARNQIFGTALLEDITGDGVVDVFIGGREALFFALDGTNGAEIWKFWGDSMGNPAQQGWYQFYNPQWLPDQDQDGVPDLLLSNGGDATVLAFDSIRPPGKLVVLSGLTGNLLAEAMVPDSHETYFSPLLTGDSSDPQVIFGSGGETVRGKMWRASLQDLMMEDLSGATLLLNDTLKGFVPVPSLADLNLDGTEDLVVPVLNRGLTVLDGLTDSVLWQLDFPGYENYVSPTIGQFTGDASPDVFGVVALGQWSFYAHFVQYLVDGGTGQIVWTDTSSIYQVTQANALDWDGDGFDEVLFMRNYDIGSTTVIYQNRLEILDFQTGQANIFGGPRSGINFFSTPLLVDLQGDQQLEIVLAHHNLDNTWNGLTGARVEAIPLNRSVGHIAWGGFMGNARDGRYVAPAATSASEVTEASTVALFPNPTTGIIRFLGSPPDWVKVYDSQGKTCLSLGRSQQLNLEGLSKGIYLIQGQQGKQRFSERVLLY